MVGWDSPWIIDDFYIYMSWTVDVGESQNVLINRRITEPTSLRAPEKYQAFYFWNNQWLILDFDDEWSVVFISRIFQRRKNVKEIKILGKSVFVEMFKVKSWKAMARKKQFGINFVFGVFPKCVL